MTNASFLDKTNVLRKTEPQPARLLFGVDQLNGMAELFGAGFAEDVTADVANRIARVLPAGVEIAACDGTRVEVTVPEIGSDSLARLVETVQTSVAFTPVETGHGPIGITVSAGAAHGEFDGRALASPAARSALSTAMNDGIGGFRVLREPGIVDNDRDVMLATGRALLGALDREHLTVAFQPVVNAGDPDRISFHECLARICQPDGSVLPAAAFMPAAEKLGLAPLVDRQMLMLAFEALAANPKARLSLNVFPGTMQDAQWLSLFESTVRADPDLGERLIIEIAETAALLDPDRSQRFADRLRDRGVTLAIDDFGAGHSSFAHLRQMRFDILKIDGQFVTGLAENPDCAFFIETLVRIAERFEMMSVAEFVETEAQAEALRGLGVTNFQGYHYGAPSLSLEGPAPTPRAMPA